MTRTKGYEVRDRNGHLVDHDDDLLRDGERLRVPMQFRDSMSEVQRAIAEDAIKRSRTTVYGPDGFIREHRETEEHVDDAALVDHAVLATRRMLADEARQESIAEQANAWHSDPFVRALERAAAAADPKEDARDAMIRDQATAWMSDRDAQPGDVCTVREGASLYGWTEGSPGTLQWVGGKLLCVPNKQDSAPTADARDEAWKQMVADQNAAWRTTSSGDVEHD